MSNQTAANLSSKEKAAILMITLGREYSARIYQHLNEDEIEQLTLAITSTRRVDTDLQDEVIEEFLEICLAQKYITEGGIDYAREVLESALGQERAYQLIHRLSSSLQVRPFDFVRKADPAQILNILQNEHPQTIALTLSYLEPPQAASVIASLSAEKQIDVIARIAKMGVTAPDFIQEAERILERKLSSMGMSESMAVGGIDSIVEIINAVDRGTEKFILEQLELADGELADEIRKRLFVFEDIAKMSNQAVQRVLREVDNNDLTVALKGAGETSDVYKLILANVSKRLAEMIKEDIEMMGPVRVRDVEEAQQKIVNTVRRLEDAGEIVTGRGGDDMIV
jgi:flagellar motor switch protein FliG